MRCPYIVTNDFDYSKLGRFLAGECSDAEAAEVREWLHDPAQRRTLELLDKVWNRSAAPPPEWDENGAWKKVAAQLEPSTPRVIKLLDHERRVPGLAWRVRWKQLPALSASAAAIALLAIGGYVWMTRSRLQSTVPLRELVTRRGQRAALDLPDGSRVVLAPGSRARFAADFGRGGAEIAREVLLEGEGYFHVRHDSARPFRVRTALAIVEDLGTDFVVDLHPEERSVKVAVVSGSVSLRRAQAAAGPPLLIVSRGDLARLDSSETVTLTANANLAPYVGWTEGNLAFDATPLREVSATIGRWYDLDVMIADSALAARRLTASFRREQPVSLVLEVIARSLDAHVERKGRSVVFRGTPR